MENLFYMIIFLFAVILMIFWMTWPISLPFLIYYIVKKNSNRKAFKKTLIQRESVKDTYIDIDDYKLGYFDTNDLGTLKNYFGGLFLDFEKAINNIDYNTLYNICTPSLYELYSSDLKVNLKLGEKKFIEDPKIEKMVIYNTTKNKTEQIVSVMLRLESRNYTMNQSGRITSGNSLNPVHEEFIVNFIKKFKKDEESSRCPNCGAMIKNTKCEYCNTEYKQYDFRINSISKLV